MPNPTDTVDDVAVDPLADAWRHDAMEAGAALVDVWNAANVPGRAVTVRRDGGRVEKTTTRSSAYLAADGTPVIFLRGIAGFHRLDRVRPYGGTDEDVAVDRASGDHVCVACGRTLREHPADLAHLGVAGVPSLVVGCDGRRLKL